MVDVFVLQDGSFLNSISDLLESLKFMNDQVFSHHVNQQKNDFVVWLKDEQPELASSLKKLHKKDQMVEVLQKFVDRNHFVYEIAIIGGGMSGIAATIYAARKRMDYITLSEDFGGQIVVSGTIENYPGIKHMDWKQWNDMLKEQLEYNDAQLTIETVKSVSKLDDGHFRITTDKRDVEAETVIIASGSRARKLAVPGEEEYEKRGVTYCAICDGPIFKGQDVAVVGGGNSALEAVDFMMRIANHIYLINLNSTLGGHENLREKVMGKEKVTVLNSAKTLRVEGDGRQVNKLFYEQDGVEKSVDVGAVFVEIGRIPNTDVFKNLVELEEKHKHIKIDKHCQTSLPGVFAAGDCTDVHEYQFSIAGGEGVKALLSAATYLAQK